MTAQSFKKGDRLVVEGEIGDKMYIILKGKTEVVKLFKGKD